MVTSLFQPLPASTLALNCYAAFLERSLLASSIPAYWNADHILHLKHSYADPTKDNFYLATTLRGIWCIQGLTVSQKKPITPQMLLAFQCHVNLVDPLHATFWAVCLVAFFGLLRKANLLSKGLTCFNPLKHLWCRDIFFFNDWVIIVNRWSKTTQFSQQLLTIPLPRILQHSLCPYTALHHAFQLIPAPLDGPAFVKPIPTAKGLSPLTFRKFDSLLKTLAIKENLNPTQISRHSFRAGRATLAFQTNLPAELIKWLEDWHSDVYRSYVHIPVKDRMQAASRLASFV